MSVPCHPDLGVSQNYLKDTRLVASLIEMSSLAPEDVVYEIGPGKGIITLQLARRCKKVVAIEKDALLCALLREKTTQLHNLVIHNNDFLLHPLPREAYKVFSNIPFNITSAIVNRLTTTHNPPDDAYLVMQKEAVGMYLGEPVQTLRSILLQPWFIMQVMHYFRRSDFSPQPHVDAVLMQISKRSPPLISSHDRQPFRDFVVYCYTAWRPTLDDTLRGIFSYNQMKHIRKDIKILPGDKPTSLCFQQWLDLYNTFKLTENLKTYMLVSGSEERVHRQQKKLKKIHRTRIL